MKPSDILRYYLKDEIIEKLLSGGKNREYAVRYNDKFGRRPMSFQYKADVERIVKSGATSIHVSEERWKNPLLLSTDIKKEDIVNLRDGWDLLIDVDCKYFDISKAYTKLVLDLLAYEGLREFSVKFSGGSGFHILVPYEGFPPEINGKDMNSLFPDAAMITSIFLKDSVKQKISEVLQKDYGARKLSEIFKMDEKELYTDGEFDPYKVIEIDTVLISERHLFRTQYSLNEKKWLVSVPIDRQRFDSFELGDADPAAVSTKIDFFDLKPSKDEAKRLFLDAYDHSAKEPERAEKEVEYKVYNLPLDEAALPPCIKEINKGLSDGRKRSVFILINFYRSIGKDKEEVNRLLLGWNLRNKPPLKENYIKQQIDYSFSGKSYPPPNCDAAGYYKYFNVCFPNETCRLIKNPLSYYIRLKAGRSDTKGRKN
ncbi:MAG: hypothetical protein OH316_02460 [Candidatus Parvarchaeota archaeon]|nr:hypothetical protein [Candidatus Parvarchaeota archaeon]